MSLHFTTGTEFTIADSLSNANRAEPGSSAQVFGRQEQRDKEQIVNTESLHSLNQRSLARTFGLTNQNDIGGADDDDDDSDGDAGGGGKNHPQKWRPDWSLFEWPCQACTYVNAPQTLECSMCGRPNTVGSCLFWDTYNRGVVLFTIMLWYKLIWIFVV